MESAWLDTLALEDDDLSYKDWVRGHTWEVPRDLSGKLVWVVSNGESLSDPSQPEAIQRGSMTVPWCSA